MWYAVVTFGPRGNAGRVHRTLAAARKAAKRVPRSSEYRVLECPTRASARAADISDYPQTLLRVV